jgi:hypothetical protein
MTQRVLGSLRISVETEDSTGIPRQRDDVQHWVDAPGRDARIVGWATDTDVSDGLHPFKRPARQVFTEEHEDGGGPPCGDRRALAAGTARRDDRLGGLW